MELLEKKGLSLWSIFFCPNTAARKHGKKVCLWTFKQTLQDNIDTQNAEQLVTYANIQAPIG